MPLSTPGLFLLEPAELEALPEVAGLVELEGLRERGLTTRGSMLHYGGRRAKHHEREK